MSLEKSAHSGFTDYEKPLNCITLVDDLGGFTFEMPGCWLRDVCQPEGRATGMEKIAE